MATLERAIEIATRAHSGQVDKAGKPYILHPLRVMMKVKTEPEMIAAVLHDVVEDSNITIEALERPLEQQGFSSDIIQTLRCLTRKYDESYNQYILRAASNIIARIVKLADLEDNMDMSRLDAITQKDLERFKKYHKAWRVLARGDSYES